MPRYWTNIDVRTYAMKRSVTLGEVARKGLGVTPQYFSLAYMGNELTDETKQKLMSIIDKIADEREKGNDAT